MTVRLECSRIEIDVLYFEDCPNHLPTIDRIYAVLREEGCDADVREVLVPDVETAQHGFPWVANRPRERHRHRTGSHR